MLLSYRGGDSYNFTFVWKSIIKQNEVLRCKKARKLKELIILYIIVLLMAELPADNIEVFLRNIPGQLREAQRQLFCDNINVIEFVQRRLEDSLFVVNILYQRSTEDHIDGSDELQHNLRLLKDELQSLCNTFDELCIRNATSEQLRFSCPVAESVRGRRRFDIPASAVSNLHGIHCSWAQVAEECGVSYRTILRRRHEYGLSVNNTSGPRNTYTDISHADLCNVREVLNILPNAGETFVFGALRQRNIHVQRWKVRNAIRAVDPLSRAMRRSVAIFRRAYNVPCPNALW